MTTTPTAPPGRRTRHPIRVIGLVTLALLAVLVAVAAIVVIARPGDNAGSSDSGTLAGSAVAATEVRKLPPFTAVDLAGANDVAISVGSEQSVVVRADDNLIDVVTTDVRAGQLVIGNRGNFRTSTPMTVTVTMPALTDLSLSGAGTLTATGVRAPTLTVRLGGAGTISASGTVDRLVASMDGTGELRLTDLRATRATAAIAGTGSIQLSASESLDATVSGTGAITYSGHPGQVTKNVTGTGAVIGQ